MDFRMFIVFAFISVITVEQCATRECHLSTYGKFINCYTQSKVNTVPIFPSYNDTLNHISLRSVWVLRSLDKNSFQNAPLTKRFTLRNIGLQHLSCDVFLRFRRDITEINLDDNLLEHFPACVINNLAHLETLTMSGNFLTCVPEHSIPGSLVNLDLSDNKILSISSSMSTDVYNPLLLKTLTINTNQLSRINDDELFQFSSLEQLDASNNRLEYIHPKSFQSSRNNITDINLSHNNLDGDIWQSLVHLQELKTLKLSHNRIEIIPEKVTFNLKNLYELDLSFNRLSSVGSAIDTRELKVLTLHHNNIVDISRNIFSVNTTFGTFFEFDVGFNLINNLSMNLSSCYECTIRAHHNRLIRLDLMLSGASSLFKMIDVSFNVLTEVPESLPPVRIFNGSHNPFSTQSIITFLEMIPRRSVQLVNFQNTRMFCDKKNVIPEIWINTSLNIDLSDNCVPIDFMCQLKSHISYTVSINLDRNMIETFLSCPLNVSVSELSVKGNRLEILNRTYIDLELSSLRSLDIAENNISVIPDLSTDVRFYNSSQNNAYHLPTKIGCARYTYIRVNILDFSSNYIQSAFGMEISCYYMSRVYFVIDVSCNDLIQIPALNMNIDRFYYSTLVFNFTKNKIEQLTVPFNYNLYLSKFFHSMIIIDLSHNNIAFLNNSVAARCGSSSYVCTLRYNLTNNSVMKFPSCTFLAGACSYCVFELDFSYNLLKMLPNNETCVITRVRMLNMSYNLLSEISMPIPNSSNLWYLTLSRNRISTITQNAFIGLSNLRELDLSFNQLQIFPEKLNEMRSLQKLNLAGNNIFSIPDAEYSIWHSLSHFYFAGNPVICSCSTAWIKNYTLKTDFGHCGYPAESVNNSVTCLSTRTCNGERVYSSKENIETCSASEFIFKPKNEAFSWDLSPKDMATTSDSRTDVLILQDCKVINYSYEKVNNIKFQNNITERDYQLCVKISDESWVTHIMECLAINNSYTENYSHTEESSTEPSIMQNTLSGSIPQDVSIGLITFLSVTVLVCGGIAGVATFIARRRGSKKGSANKQRTIQGNCSQQNDYENVVSKETSFSSPVADNYDNLQITDDNQTYEDI